MVFTIATDTVKAVLWRNLLLDPFWQIPDYLLWPALWTAPWPDPIPPTDELRPCYTTEDALPLGMLRSSAIPRYPTIV